MTPKNQRVPISERALIQRLNRRLAPDDLVVRKSRTNASIASVGLYYLVNTRSGFIDYPRVDLEELGSEYDVLNSWEELAE